MVSEGMKMRTEWSIFKFHDKDNTISKAIHNGMKIDEAIKTFGLDKFIEKVSWIGNAGLNDGIVNILNFMTGLGTPTAWSHSVAKLGVGDSATAQTDPTIHGLLASTNHTAVGMDTSYPSIASETITFQATFGAGVATWHWQEYCVTTSSETTGICINRCVSDKGVKGSGDSWILQVQITMS